MQIVDALGLIVVEEKYVGNSQTIDLSYLATGMYYLKLTDNNNIDHIIKFTKE